MRTPYDLDPHTCSECWGIIPPEGTQMVPDDGQLCECEAAPPPPLTLPLGAQLIAVDSVFLNPGGVMTYIARVHYGRDALDVTFTGHRDSFNVTMSLPGWPAPVPVVAAERFGPFSLTWIYRFFTL